MVILEPLMSGKIYCYASGIPSCLACQNVILYVLELQAWMENITHYKICMDFYIRKTE